MRYLTILPLAAVVAGVVATMTALAPVPAVKAADQPAALPSVLKIGYKAAATGACAAPDGNTPAGLAELAKHLGGRLDLSVQFCAFADPAAAAAALAQGTVDLADITPVEWGAVQGKGRPILTLRPDGKLPRTPILAVAAKASGDLDAAAISAKRVVLIHQDPLAYDAARAAVLTHGGAALAKAQTPVAGTLAAALGEIGSGKADVALVPADMWKNGCADDKTLCPPYRAVWKQRPVAARAWVLRSGLPDELRYRLIGIFLGLHLENPQAYAGVSGGVKGAFEPTEATALDGVLAQ